MMARFASILFSMIVVNNLVLVRFLGICPFLGVSKKLEAATGMGFAVSVVMVLSVAITWPINQVLNAYDMAYLQTIAYILVIATLVQLLEIAIKRFSKSLYDALGTYLPLITTNCAVLGVVLLNTQYSFNFLQSVVYGVTGGAGFMLAICLMASVREKIEFADYPESFNGFPIALVTAGLIALAFMGFSGMKIV